MKQYMKYMTTMVALLAMTVGTWATSVTINVLPSQASGTVTQSISGGVCTLTVTPASGYQASLENISVELTVSGSVAQAPRRSPDIYHVEVTALTSNADPSGETQYQFTVPDATYDATVTVEFQRIQYTYDAATHTLTLDNATITSGDNWAFEYDVPVLTVKLIGTNTITGNAFNFGNQSKPALVFTTDPITSGSLTVSGSLTSPAEGADGATIVYENGLQKAVAEAGSVISGTPINLKVGGTTVTSQNMNDILSDGKVSFNAQTLTLTLNGANIDMRQKNGYPIESDIQNLKVLMIDNNTLQVYEDKPYGFQFSNQANTGTLTFTHQENGFGSLTVKGATAIANGYTVACNTQETGWTVAETSIGYDAVFGVQIGGTAFTASTLTMTSGNGSATYNPLTQTLSLNNYTTAETITTTLTNLTISLTGVNSVGALTNNGQSQTDTLTIERNTASTAAVNKLTAQVTGFETVTVTDPLKEISAGVYSDVVAYKLWVNDTQVTRENMENVMTGVSFDGDHTLTLRGVSATASNAPFITNGMSKLTIHLVGTNTVNCGQQSFLTKNDGDNDHQVTFTTNPNAVGRLTISNVADEWFTGHSTPTCQNGLAVTSSEGTVTIAIPQVTEYGLSIAGIAVTNENAENVTGTGITAGSVKYDAIYKVLTLNGATISGDITSNIEELKIELNGGNTVTGFNRTAANKGKLKFALGGDKGNLTLTTAIPTENFDVTLIDNLDFYNDYKAIALPVSYGISVAGVAITRDNRTNVTGSFIDGTVRFDNNARLVLEKADINGQIVVDNAATLPNNSLTIYLKGRNSINSALPAIKCNSGKLKVAFEFDNQTESRIEIFSETPQVDENNAFSGVTLSNKDALRLSTMTSVLKIEPYLPLIVDDQTQTATVDFSQMSALTNVNGTVVNKVEYNLGSETDDKENSSGIDQTTGKLVFGQNDVMTDAQVEQAKENEDLFKGLKMVVPAGLIEVGLQGVDLPAGYDMGVSIGNQKPVSVRDVLGQLISKAVENADAIMSLMSAHSQELRLWVFPASVWNPAPQMASRRIGPKSSVAGGLGGISVQNNSVQSSQGPAETYKAMELSAVSAAIAAVTDVHDGFSCSDPDITDLPDDMFVDKSSSSAPRRAAKTILPDGLTFIDFSNTKITGMEVSRSKGAFNGVPENVFIYMPAGNTTKEKNVVIGSICDVMELDGSDNAQPFKAMKNFKAAQATLNREFDAEENSTVYLPYSISKSDAGNMGLFYAFDKIENDNVNMTAVTGDLAANTPYIFKAKSGGVTNPQVKAVDIVAGAAGSSEFLGVYERTDYSGQDNWYCYSNKGQFVKMKSGAYVPPFRAYFVASNTNAPILSILWDGKEEVTTTDENTTAVETVKTVADKKVADGWWTLNGVRLNAQPKKAGLYVKDGRLVVVR